MKIFAFTDTHGDMAVLDEIKEKITVEPVDHVLCCGDITNFGASQERIVKKIASFPAHVMMIHGNHETAEGLMRDCEKYENITFLHSSAFRDGKFLFFGYGGDGFSVKDKTFRQVSERFMKDINKEDIAVMMFHGPPYGALDETISGNSGNKDYRKAIEKIMPVKVFCGHIHESGGRKSILGNTLVINPGPKGMFLDV